MIGVDCVCCNVLVLFDCVFGLVGKVCLLLFIFVWLMFCMLGLDGVGIELDVWRVKLVWWVVIVKWVLFDCVDFVVGLCEVECVWVVGGVVVGVDGVERFVVVGGVEVVGVGDVLFVGDVEFLLW